MKTVRVRNLRTMVFCGVVWLSAAGVARAQSVDAADDVSSDASDAADVQTNLDDGGVDAVDAILAGDVRATDAGEATDAGVVADAGVATDAGAATEAGGADGAVSDGGADGGKTGDGGGSDGP
jgi:hypothetical protein